MDPHTEKIKQERAITRMTGLTRSQIRDSLRSFAQETKTQNVKMPNLPGPQNSFPMVQFSEQTLERKTIREDTTTSGSSTPGVDQAPTDTTNATVVTLLLNGGVPGYGTVHFISGPFAL